MTPPQLLRSKLLRPEKHYSAANIGLHQTYEAQAKIVVLRGNVLQWSETFLSGRARYMGCHAHHNAAVCSKSTYSWLGMPLQFITLSWSSCSLPLDADYKSAGSQTSISQIGMHDGSCGEILKKLRTAVTIVVTTFNMALMQDEKATPFPP